MISKQLTEKLERIGVRVPRILLPKEGVDMSKWAVVACDQFTSEPEYWAGVERLVAEVSSTYKITLPEVYLESPDKQERIKEINEEMKKYLDEEVLEEKFEGFVLVERTLKSGKERRGLMVALDLEKYDYHKGSKTLIRATEGTVEARIPPRLEIRKEALIELPHIMVLINDKEKNVIEKTRGEEVIYDFDLMMNGGHVRGWKIMDEREIEKIAEALEKLISSDGFLFAMGDGNHSLATAKAHWNNLKTTLSNQEQETHPARFALVELVNVYDDGLEFEPIHRLVYKVESDKLIKFLEGDGEEVAVIMPEGGKKIRIKNRGSNLPVGNLQILLDKYLEENPETKIDYIHGREAVEKLASELQGVGFILPGMDKLDLFPTVEKDGALPRKTFSMGEAQEKRYYLEARKIVR
ncbi:MAG: DUF1015 domain-containing protein [Candidatus Shapirobacteria bacterium]